MKYLVKKALYSAVPQSLFCDIVYFYNYFLEYDNLKKRIRELDEREGRNGKHYKYTLRGFVEKRSIFFRIPRAASNSVSYALFGHLAGGHKTAMEYKKTFGPCFDYFYKFTFVRNPFARLVSAYDYLKSGGHPVSLSDKRFGEEVINSYEDFSDFVINWLDSDKRRYEKPHFYPQVHFLTIDDSLSVDFIGCVESVEEDFSRVKSKLGEDCKLPNKNAAQGNRKPIESFYTKDSVIEKVINVYEKDFVELGYSSRIKDVGKPPKR